MNLLTLNFLKKGEKAIIENIVLENVPLKLIEMGCMKGHHVEMIQKAPFGDPIYFKINDSHVAIRVETAQEITVSLISDTHE
jgi:ferrous iron transport protein A